MKIGLIVRLDRTGLGYQTRALARMLKPAKILEISNGEDIPAFARYHGFLEGLDVFLTAETPYTYEAWNWAKLLEVRTFCQPNWEFFDGLIQPNMPHPDRYIMPSYWHLEDMIKLFPETVYLPPPTIEDDFRRARRINWERKGKRRFVHIVGQPAIYDRNGWGIMMDALSYTKSDFELVIFSQKPITGYSDPRVRYHIFDIEDQTDLYTDFDALILPRRYGGLCLPMNEALLTGLPVIMTDISPNHKILPQNWLLPAYQSASFEARATIEVYSVDPRELASKIDDLCTVSNTELQDLKTLAYQIGHDNFSDKLLKPKYLDLLMS